MTPKKMLQNLADTPFSKDRLIIWVLGLCAVMSLMFIGILGYQEKEIPPSLTMAFGVTVVAFVNKFEEDK